MNEHAYTAELLAQEVAKINQLHQDAGQAQDHPSPAPSKEIVTGNPDAMRESLMQRMDNINIAIEFHENRLSLLGWEYTMCEAALKAFKEHSEAPQLDRR